jgi:hypothetical protein
MKETCHTFLGSTVHFMHEDLGPGNRLAILIEDTPVYREVFDQFEA